MREGESSFRKHDTTLHAHTPLHTTFDSHENCRIIFHAGSALHFISG